VKSAQGQASYYSSQPFYKVEGEIAVEGREVAVTGVAWLDREWSSQPLSPGQEGWDWFALHLGSGAKVMLYRFREGGGASRLAGTWITPDGNPEPLGGDELAADPTEWAEVAGREVPVAWRLAIPSRGFAVDTRPLNAQSWMGTTFPYWEGPIRFAGTHRGRGYLEMTGYD
jgi:predicted secreted hydrolase